MRLRQSIVTKIFTVYKRCYQPMLRYFYTGTIKRRLKFRCKDTVLSQQQAPFTSEIMSLILTSDS